LTDLPFAGGLSGGSPGGGLGSEAAASEGVAMGPCGGRHGGRLWWWSSTSREVRRRQASTAARSSASRSVVCAPAPLPRPLRLLVAPLPAMGLGCWWIVWVRGNPRLAGPARRCRRPRVPGSSLEATLRPLFPPPTHLPDESPKSLDWAMSTCCAVTSLEASPGEMCGSGGESKVGALGLDGHCL
jgi:hypothetical protein